MAEEITARLACVDPADPVKYDFALCHKRMSGDCLDRRDPVVCRAVRPARRCAATGAGHGDRTDA